MSASSAKASAFPTSCANSACGQGLCGPVIYCPFCGVSLQQAPVAVTPAPEPKARPATPVPKATVTPASIPPALDVPAAAPTPVPGPAACAPAPSAAPIPVPSNRKPALILAVATLVVVVGGYAAIKMMAGQSQQKLDGFLQTGQSCFDTKDFACALDNAGLALQQDSNDPRALSLLQRAQAAQARHQQLQDAVQKQQQLKAQAAETSRQADALREQQALERQRQEAADRQVRDQQQQQAAKAVNASLQQAQNALNAGEYQSAIAVAKVVLGMDPNNNRARNIIRQAEQQLKEALNRTRIE